eukprot:gene2559-biopygen398
MSRSSSKDAQSSWEDSEGSSSGGDASGARARGALVEVAGDAKDSPRRDEQRGRDIPSPPSGEGKWRRGILSHWNRVRHCGSVWARGLTYYTFRSAFITPGRLFPKPIVDDKVFWKAGPDRKDPDVMAATMVVRLDDYPDLSIDIKDSIRDDFTEEQFTNFRKFDTSKPGQN